MSSPSSYYVTLADELDCVYFKRVVQVRDHVELNELRAALMEATDSNLGESYSVQLLPDTAMTLDEFLRDLDEAFPEDSEEE